ncbi:hypothetical protein [Priestia megaterium]|uniref:hypothetical protein n=1 Tax=Priestia megaterium TaxID=1404 RepID=UPI00211CC3C5|nr:hypothetical protein [Priestia megaterium]
MALKKNVLLSVFGKDLHFDMAYHEISSYSGTKEKTDFIMSVYDNSEKTNLIDQKSYSFSPDIQEGAANIITQAYNYLKTMDEYKDAVDVLEQGQI